MDMSSVPKVYSFFREPRSLGIKTFLGKMESMVYIDQAFQVEQGRGGQKREDFS